MSEPGRKWLWRAAKCVYVCTCVSLSICVAYIKLKAHVAEDVSSLGVAQAAERSGVTRKFAAYTFTKSIDPDFHPDTQGGARNTLLDDDEQALAEHLLWLEVKVNPARRVVEFARALQLLGAPINEGWVRRVLKRWRLSLKKIRWRAADKYTSSNIINYAAYCLWFTSTVLRRCKFLDESHFQRGGALFLL